MTAGVLDRFPVARLAVAVTGIAGPGWWLRREAGRADLRGGRAPRRRRGRRAPHLAARPRRQQARIGARRHRARDPRGVRAAGVIRRPGERIHVIGIAGSGAAGRRLLLHARRSRRRRLRRGRPLAVHAAARCRRHSVAAGHDPAHLDGVDRVAITPAIRAAAAPSGARRGAEAAGIPVATWQAMLGELMAAPGRIGIGVTGHARQVDDDRACSAISS